ncbi:MAG: AAA domain-containing protein [Elusimicrobiota bacterium]|jgi:superfamily I DNA and/or RNA helicase
MPREPMFDAHFEKFLDLIDQERKAEQAENERKLDLLPVQAREALGKAITRLVVVREDFGVGGHPLWVLSRPSAGEEYSPFQALNQGDLVNLTFAENPENRIKGTLYDVDQFEVTVALNGPMLDEAPKGKCQLDILGSEATYKRMKKALNTVMSADKPSVEHLRDVLMGKEKPSYQGYESIFPSSPSVSVGDPSCRLTACLDSPPVTAGNDARETTTRDDGGAPRNDISFFNLRLNPYQREAVEKALAAQDVAVVHGPPGTGKTTVLVEIVQQAVARGARVLASAPSNIAVDNLLEKLLDTGLRVVRMGHPARILDSLRHATLSALVTEHDDQRHIQELDQQRERLIRQLHRGRGMEWAERKQIQREIQALWQEARDIEFGIGKQILAQADVVLATHGGIAKPILKKPFDLLIMDEASQATEPLSWIPILQAKKVIIAGDPLQLPPTIYSEETKKQGLGVTLMERLQKILPPEGQTLLRIQYRMHETIMGFSSRQFYDGKLEADDSVRRHTASEMPDVTTNALTQNPLMFVDTAGAGYEESWNELLESRENEGEAKLALYLYQQLRESGIVARAMALLTPYVAQARLLRNLVGPDRSIEIGSIDGFQGREKEVVILSLVRSNHRGEVGFLGDTRRMNVGMTRARRLLIVLGDSTTLARHPFYNQFIEYADAHEAHHSAWEWINEARF